MSPGTLPKDPFALSLSKGERAFRWLRHATALLLAGGLLVTGIAGAFPAHADDGWGAEFDAVCSKTQDAMTLPDDELRDLIRRCDALKPRVEALDDSRRKVYGKRLQLCRDLYAFVLESRKGG